MAILQKIIKKMQNFYTKPYNSRKSEENICQFMKSRTDTNLMDADLKESNH